MASPVRFFWRKAGDCMKYQRNPEAPKALRLTAGSDRTLAGAGEAVRLWGLAENTGDTALPGFRLRLCLPEELTGTGGDGERPLCGLAPGERAMVWRTVSGQPGGPLPVSLTAEGEGWSASSEPLQLWLTDRSCCRKAAGCTMEEALAARGLSGLFGLSELETALLLEYLSRKRPCEGEPWAL